MIRRKKLTIFTDAKDTTTVLELKKIIEGKLSPLKLIISHSHVRDAVLDTVFKM